MKSYLILSICLLMVFWGKSENPVADHFKEVDQVLWVVKDIDNAVKAWEKMRRLEPLESPRTRCGIGSNGVPI